MSQAALAFLRIADIVSKAGASQYAGQSVAYGTVGALCIVCAVLVPFLLRGVDIVVPTVGEEDDNRSLINGMDEEEVIVVGEAPGDRTVVSSTSTPLSVFLRNVWVGYRQGLKDALHNPRLVGRDTVWMQGLTAGRRCPTSPR